MRFNEQDSEVRLGLFVLLMLIIGICFMIKIINKYYSFYRYLEYIKSESFSKIIFILHLTITVVSALLLSNYLGKYNFYNDIIKQSQIWDYITLLFLFIFFLLAYGICLNFIFCEKEMQKNEHKIGNN
ncbi:hypothetical protein [Flavobacterium marginilacus]|uniref:hypothetical protein n=1 Tax=Flavobacterium marginilacus TaxID=3003256 RepID=UPI00248E930A|nr:hypothetical protein [Flavobacterium marginilacus]